MDRRFAALRVVGTVAKVFGWIVLILGILVAILVLILGFAVSQPLAVIDFDLGGPLVGVLGFVVILTLAIVLFLALYGAGEFLYLLLSIEDSSRRTAYILQQQFMSGPPGYAAALPPELLEDSD